MTTLGLQTARLLIVLNSAGVIVPRPARPALNNNRPAPKKPKFHKTSAPRCKGIEWYARDDRGTVYG
jgi:hypothetical protein